MCCSILTLEREGSIEGTIVLELSVRSNWIAIDIDTTKGQQRSVDQSRMQHSFRVRDATRRIIVQGWSNSRDREDRIDDHERKVGNHAERYYPRISGTI